MRTDSSGVAHPKALRAPNKTSAPAACVRSPQLRVLRFGRDEDGDVGVGVFPKGEEILVLQFQLWRCHLASRLCLRVPQTDNVARKCTCRPSAELFEMAVVGSHAADHGASQSSA